MPSGEPGIWGRKLLGKKENKRQFLTRNRFPVGPTPRRRRPLREGPPRLPVPFPAGRLRLSGHAPTALAAPTRVLFLIHSTNTERQLYLTGSGAWVYSKAQNSGGSFPSRSLQTIGELYNRKTLKQLLSCDNRVRHQRVLIWGGQEKLL